VRVEGRFGGAGVVTAELDVVCERGSQIGPAPAAAGGDPPNRLQACDQPVGFAVAACVEKGSTIGRQTLHRHPARPEGHTTASLLWRCPATTRAEADVLSPAGHQAQAAVALAILQNLLHRTAAPPRIGSAPQQNPLAGLCACSANQQAGVGLGTDHREAHSRHLIFMLGLNSLPETRWASLCRCPENALRPDVRK